MLTIERFGEMNEWWKTGHVKAELAPSYKRKMFYEVQKYLNERQIISIVGLRRTGKSTVLYQIIESLINEGVSPEKILYFSFDEDKEDIRDLLKFYQERIVKKQIEAEKVYVFLDEIQKLDNWQNKIKVIYDLHPNIKFFISGSASLNILLDSKDSLAGRIFYFHMDVLSFEEFLELKGKNLNKIMENIDLWKSELRTKLNEYMLKSFPEIVNASDEIAKKYIKESVVEKAIFRDLSALFEIKDVELIEKLIHILASNPGMIINMDDLSKDIGRSRQIISNYLYYLECCFMVKSVKNFRGSLKVSSRKMKKYYLSHPCIALAIEHPDAGRAVENLVLFAAKAMLFWRAGNKEVDFIIQNENITPIESKYTMSVKTSDIKGLLKFMDIYKCKKGLVVTDDYEAEEEHRDGKIRFIPLWKWLLQL